ncbi:hypothetical protein GCM10023328_40630 [Modestobacter marinus]|uniref:Uncharacterized protein n=1 Tax=Modestobacter marinus TaxID=477641 RepID=A0A846LQ90_9ACTN|nr:hypothetical protein [Modestobacter marinus]NIH68634.1 hypothetical protein [Modestobacter marinus]GGL58852.1 hypothetical protein GCM10011589_13560 [Modestobacter marinus]
MDIRLSTTMDDLDRLAHQEKLALLHSLAELVWDIEDELARARAVRAELMTSVQEDLRHAGVR